jgi:hypothetical protein
MEFYHLLIKERRLDVAAYMRMTGMDYHVFCTNELSVAEMSIQGNESDIIFLQLKYPSLQVLSKSVA